MIAEHSQQPGRMLDTLPNIGAPGKGDSTELRHSSCCLQCICAFQALHVREARVRSTNFPIDRHASGFDASQLSYIPVALRYESQGVGLAELVSPLVVFFHL